MFNNIVVIQLHYMLNKEVKKKDEDSISLFYQPNTMLLKWRFVLKRYSQELVKHTFQPYVMMYNIM